MPRFLFLFATALIAACGGRTLDDEFTGPYGGSSADSATRSDDTRGSVEDGFVGDDVFFGEDAISVDVSPERDTSPPPPLDSGPRAGITCGMTSCDPATQQCCVVPSAGGATSSCRKIGDCGGRSLALSCTSAATCKPGEVCCLRLSMMGSSSTCATTCGGGGGESYRLCTSDADCRMGERCRGTTVGIRVCLPSGGGGGSGGGGSGP